jgi:hypothetical protein
MCWRPLEPDAGNAAEGSQGPMPDWQSQPCDFPRMAFFVVKSTNQENRNAGKEFSFCSDSFLPTFLIQFFYERV